MCHMPHTTQLKTGRLGGGYGIHSICACQHQKTLDVAAEMRGVQVGGCANKQAAGGLLLYIMDIHGNILKIPTLTLRLRAMWIDTEAFYLLSTMITICINTAPWVLKNVSRTQPNEERELQCALCVLPHRASGDLRRIRMYFLLCSGKKRALRMINWLLTGRC